MEYYVSTTGNDAGPGTRERPFATLERARDEVRKLDRSQAADGPVIVEIAGGTYELARPFELGAEDSGSAQSPVEYRARKGEEVRISGGKVVAGWEPVGDAAMLERLAPPAREEVRQADLGALGITDLQGINSPERYRSDPGLELFFRDEPLPLVRFADNLIDVDPRFAGQPPADFRLAEDSPAREFGFQPIPFGRIGVYEDDDRASWPVTSR